MDVDRMEKMRVESARYIIFLPRGLWRTKASITAFPSVFIYLVAALLFLLKP